MTSAAIRVGDFVGGVYRVEGLLGTGGMATVLRATCITSNRPVAIKVMKEEAARDAVMVERFARESRATLRLRGEHVARVLDVGATVEGLPFIVMECLDGSDLAGISARRGPLPISEAVGYILQACEAVAEAHALRIIHRDLTLKNLFLARRSDSTSVVKVLDFGIAKTLTVDGAPREASLTKDSSPPGSPHFVSPEHIRAARDMDHRSDLWSLGVCLYVLLAARPPFDAASGSGVIGRILAAAPEPIQRRRADVPEGLAAVIARCLEKDRKRRFRDVGSLSEALRPFATGYFGGAPASAFEGRRGAAGASQSTLPAVGPAAAWDDAPRACAPRALLVLAVLVAVACLTLAIVLAR